MIQQQQENRNHNNLQVYNPYWTDDYDDFAYDYRYTSCVFAFTTQIYAACFQILRNRSGNITIQRKRLKSFVFKMEHFSCL